MWKYNITNGEVYFYLKNENNLDLKDISTEEHSKLINDVNKMGGYIKEVDNKLICKSFPPKPDGVRIVFDFINEIWIDNATLDEQIEHYKNLIIQKTKEHELLKVSGFTGSQEEINLQTEINNLKRIYMDKNHELALQIENRLK